MSWHRLLHDAAEHEGALEMGKGFDVSRLIVDAGQVVHHLELQRGRAQRDIDVVGKDVAKTHAIKL